MAIRDQERQRLARDIHDCLGQHVTALRLSLDALSAEASNGTPWAARLVRTQRLAEELDHSIDALTRQLRPAAFDNVELAVALQQLVSDWSGRFGMPAECYVPPIDPISLKPEAASQVCRLVQEALHNVTKHARATCVSVSFVRRDREYVLLVEDDGRGFNVAAATSMSEGRSGFGLTAMRERAALAGGQLEIESSPGRGTTIVARIPAPDRGPAHATAD